MVSVTSIAIDYAKVPDAIRWCHQHVGDAKYYLHNQTGGAGWRVVRSRVRADSYFVEFVNEKDAVLFSLSV